MATIMASWSLKAPFSRNRRMPSWLRTDGTAFFFLEGGGSKRVVGRTANFGFLCFFFFLSLSFSCCHFFFVYTITCTDAGVTAMFPCSMWFWRYHNHCMMAEEGFNVSDVGLGTGGNMDTRPFTWCTDVFLFCFFCFLVTRIHARLPGLSFFSLPCTEEEAASASASAMGRLRGARWNLWAHLSKANEK